MHKGNFYITSFAHLSCFHGKTLLQNWTRFCMLSCCSFYYQILAEWTQFLSLLLSDDFVIKFSNPRTSCLWSAGIECPVMCFPCLPVNQRLTVVINYCLILFVICCVFPSYFVLHPMNTSGKHITGLPIPANHRRVYLVQRYIHYTHW